MAQHSTTYYDGTEEYLATLSNYKQYVQDVVVRRALLDGGRILSDAERERAPVLKGTEGPGSSALEPGALKDGIRMYAREYEGEQQVVVGPNGNTAHVAAFVELGHVLVRGKGDAARVIGEVGPHPFLRPAYESSIEGVFEAVRDSMKEQLKEVIHA